MPEPVVVPDRDLETPVGELVEADGLPRDGVLPLGVEGAAADGRLLLARLAPLGKKVAAVGEENEMFKVAREREDPFTFKFLPRRNF